jgi:CHAT domain
VDFLNSEYVQKLDLFSEQNKSSARSGLVIPVKVAPCYVDHYLDISKLHWVNLYDPKEAAPGQKTLQNAQNTQEKSDVTAGGIREVIEALDAYAQAQSGGFSASRAETMDPAEQTALKPLRDQEPGALLIAVERNKTVFLLPPGAASGRKYPLSAKGLPQKVLSILQRLMLKGDLEDEDCQALGEALFYRLFPDAAARQLFEEAYRPHAEAQGGSPLKIILHFDETSAALAGLPWEYLWFPPADDDAEGFFIGEKENLALTRRLSGAGEKNKQVSTDKLRILVAISKPKQPAEAKNMDDDADVILKRFAGAGLQHIEIRKEIPGSEAEFRTLIENNPTFHIVHFIGKGKIEKDPKTGAETSFIALCDAKTGAENWLKPEDFVACFEGLTPGSGKERPNVLFLHAIRDTPDSCQSLRNMAIQLVNSLDGVLAIQTPVLSEEAAEFSEQLYTALEKGKDLDVAAVQAARFLADKTTRRLRMYGISATFSRKTLKLEVAQPASIPAAGASFTFLWCPNHDNDTAPCSAQIAIDGGKPTRVYCRNCDAGPLWLCPSCKTNVANLSEKRCRCGFETAKMSVPDDLRKRLPSAQTMPNSLKTSSAVSQSDQSAAAPGSGSKAAAFDQ